MAPISSGCAPSQATSSSSSRPPPGRAWEGSSGPPRTPCWCGPARANTDWPPTEWPQSPRVVSAQGEVLSTGLRQNGRTHLGLGAITCVPSQGVVLCLSWTKLWCEVDRHQLRFFKQQVPPHRATHGLPFPTRWPQSPRVVRPAVPRPGRRA